MDIREYISGGSAILGLELGSTRIKATLIGSDHSPIASGSHSWENQLVNGVWTYSLDAVWAGVRDAYADLKRDVNEKYGVKLTKLRALGISGMMHGYLPFDKDGKQLCEFRTWRNTMTEQAAAELTALFSFNIPQRWSIAHLYQAILNGEEHVKDIDFITTIAGYIHWQLSGKKVVGAGEASGMFPINGIAYDEEMAAKFDELAGSKGFGRGIIGILPAPLSAGEDAGTLTAEGAKLLDPSGELLHGAVMAPPEGDAGTGMTATNSVRPRTGNVSGGTSVFSMVVLEKPLSKVYTEIDVAATPDGAPVAMVHCNNCTSDINAWAELLCGFAQSIGVKADMGDIYTSIFSSALSGKPDADGIINVNFLSGEHIAGVSEGRPLICRNPNSELSYANFTRSLLMGALSTLRIGNEILKKENVAIDSMLGHGGFFKTPLSGQKIMAAALGAPVSVMETAGEGGPWGMALLAAYAVEREASESLSDYLSNKVFAGAKGSTVEPDRNDVAGFEAYSEGFGKALKAEKALI